MPPGSRILSGPEAVKQASTLRKRQDNKELFPYEWYYPPRNAKREMPSASIVAPAAGVTTTILSYTVPTGFYFILWGILQVFTGTGFTDGGGQAIWDTLLNPATQSLPVQSLSQIPYHLGSFDFGWFKFPSPDFYVSTDTLLNQVTTTADIALGAPNTFSTMFVGWLLPSSDTKA
jgi:hypothetical protein